MVVLPHLLPFIIAIVPEDIYLIEWEPLMLMMVTFSSQKCFPSPLSFLSFYYSSCDFGTRLIVSINFPPFSLLTVISGDVIMWCDSTSHNAPCQKNPIFIKIYFPCPYYPSLSVYKWSRAALAFLERKKIKCFALPPSLYMLTAQHSFLSLIYKNSIVK